MLTERRIANGVTRAVRHFWKTRAEQAQRKARAGRADQGARAAVTGGKQMHGFVSIVRDVIIEAGLAPNCIHIDAALELPGYFRPEKKWDLVVVDGSVLVAAIEFKSQVGPSFGNNFNNRSEEAIGTAQDIWIAFREGAFSMSNRPWLGYLMMLEHCRDSTSPVAVREPHFSVFSEFRGASYARRYQLMLNRLVRERLYDSTCFILSTRTAGKRGHHGFPDANLSMQMFATSLAGHIVSHVARQ